MTHSISKSIRSSKPSTILTGFLGAGKTTFLNHILNKKSDIRYAIIENEYGQESIDSELILRAEDDIIELNNGCLCCTLNDNLYEILNTLYERSDEYDELIIEATGVADPRGLAAPFINNYAIKKQFPLTRIICLVDAEQVEQQIKNTEEAIHQITFSDVLLVNKTDLVDKGQLKKIDALLTKLNPLAEIIYGNHEGYPSLDTSMRNNELNEKTSGHEHCHSSSEDSVFPVKQPHAHHDHDHTDGVESHTLVFNQPFDYPKLHLRLLSFLTFQAKGLYRMKGLIWVGQSGQQMLLQTVGPRMSIEEKRPWKAQETKGSRIVVIGKNFQKKSLEKMFTQCFQKTGQEVL